MAHRFYPHIADAGGQEHQAIPCTTNVSFLQHPQQQNTAFDQHIQAANGNQEMVSPLLSGSPPTPDMNLGPRRMLAVLALPSPSDSLEAHGFRNLRLSHPDLFHWICLTYGRRTYLNTHTAWAACAKFVLLIAEEDFERLEGHCRLLFTPRKTTWSSMPRIITRLEVQASGGEELVDRFSKLCYFRMSGDQTATEYLWWPGQLTGPEAYGFCWPMIPRSTNSRWVRNQLVSRSHMDFAFTEDQLRRLVQSNLNSQGSHVVRHFNAALRNPDADTFAAMNQTQPCTTPPPPTFSRQPSSDSDPAAGQQVQALATEEHTWTLPSAPPASSAAVSTLDLSPIVAAEPSMAHHVSPQLHPVPSEQHHSPSAVAPGSSIAIAQNGLVKSETVVAVTTATRPEQALPGIRRRCQDTVIPTEARPAGDKVVTNTDDPSAGARYLLDSHRFVKEMSQQSIYHAFIQPDSRFKMISGWDDCPLPLTIDPCLLQLTQGPSHTANEGPTSHDMAWQAARSGLGLLVTPTSEEVPLPHLFKATTPWVYEPFDPSLEVFVDFSKCADDGSLGNVLFDEV